MLSTLLDYIPDADRMRSNPACRWYVLRGTDNNAITAAETFSSFGIPAFTPLEYKATLIGENKVWEQVSCQPDLVFAYGTYDAVRNAMTHNTLVSYSFVCSDTDSLDPMTPSEECVDNLIKIVMASIPLSYSVTDQEIHYRPGGLVRVTDGPFQGVIGRGARIHTQTRVVATIPGIISYATTYVPKHQLAPVVNDEQLATTYPSY